MVKTATWTVIGKLKKVFIPVLAFFAALSVVFAFQYKFPVAIFMHATKIELLEAKIKLHVSGFKVRSDCRPVKDSYTGYVLPGDGFWEEVAGFHFENDPSPNSSKGYGWNKFEIWVWPSTYKPVELEQVRMIMQHNCGTNIIISEYNFPLR